MPARVIRDEEESRIRETYPWGSLTWLANESLVGSSNLSAAKVVINLGKSNTLHAHDGSDEILHLLQGELSHKTGDETVLLMPGDTLHIPAGVAHNATNTGTLDAVMIVMYSEGSRSFRRIPD